MSETTDRNGKLLGAEELEKIRTTVDEILTIASTDSWVGWCDALLSHVEAQQEQREELLGTIEFLWQIIDDIDTADDWAKDNDRAYRQAVCKLQYKRWQTGITTDGQELDLSNLQQPTPQTSDTTETESEMLDGSTTDDGCGSAPKGDL